jgi:hypothetical protein
MRPHAVGHFWIHASLHYRMFAVQFLSNVLEVTCFIRSLNSHKSLRELYVHMPRSVSQQTAFLVVQLLRATVTEDKE